MAIVSSVIKVYADQNKQTLVTSVTTSGSAVTIPLDNLDPGTPYWATVTATDNRGITSPESQVYQFYTLPYIEFSGTMHTGTDWFSSLLAYDTNGVGISRWGIIYDTSSSFTDPTYVEVHPMPTQEVVVSGLTEGTTYYARATVLDEFGRRWTNPNTVTVATDGSIPTITWTGFSSLGPTSFTHNVNIQSTSALTSVVAVYTPYGGSPVTVTLSNTTGTQAVNLTGLTPNTNYTLVVRATNAAGTAESIAQTFTTSGISIDVKLTSVSVSNSNNIITVESEAAADASCTITGHYVDMFMTADIARNPVEEVSGGANDQIRVNLGHADPDTTYFLYGKVTYTIGSDPTVYTAWSEPLKVDTYSLLAFTSITPTSDEVEVRYAVMGTADSIDIQYSADGTNWHPMTQGVIRSGVVGYGLAPNTSYQLRGRCRSNAGWCDYVYDSFITESTTTAYVSVDSVTNITSGGADVNLTISES